MSGRWRRSEGSGRCVAKVCTPCWVHLLIHRLIYLTAGPSTEEPEDEEDDSDVETVPETDHERRRAMLDATTQSDLDDQKGTRTDFSSDFIFPSATSDSEEGPSCDVQVLPRPSATAASGTKSSKGKRTSSGSEAPSRGLGEGEATMAGPRKKTKGDPAYGNLVQDETKQRRFESLGLTSGGRRLGGDRVGKASTRTHTQPHAHGPASGLGRMTVPDQSGSVGEGWSCLVCTL